MATLHVDLREGWHHHQVRLSIDGEETWSGEDVTTRQQIGLAQQLTFEVPPGPKELRISASTEGHQVVAVQKQFELSGEHWIGISLTNGEFDFRDQDSEFGYV